MRSTGAQHESSGPRISRRQALVRAGALTFGGLSLADWLCTRAQAGATAAGNGRAVIQVFMGGGPSHLDLYDLKPDAPAEFRGEFQPISTALPGVHIGEHLPHLARALKHVAIVRSVTHANAGHLPASHWMMTGYQPPQSATMNYNPSLGAVVARTRGPNQPGMPPYVSIPRRQLLGASAYLGPACNPFTPESDPNAANFAVRNLGFPAGIDPARLDDRRGLLRRLDRMQASAQVRDELAGIDRFSREALDIVSGSRAQQAFDLNRESTTTRDRYGRTSAGQGCLLARRLVEAGVTLVTVLSGGEWDTHRDNFNILKNKSLPPVDRALAALVSDLHERGLDDRVMVLVTGEFGRTPTINKDAGRDHWPGAFSVLFAGGGLRVGQVLGATDARGAHPITRPYSPGDVLATAYDFLGIDTTQEFHDHSGRPLRILPEGSPIAELRG